jgi:hypothetical protein
LGTYTVPTDRPSARTDIRDCEQGFACRYGSRSACDAGFSVQTLTRQSECTACRSCPIGETATTACTTRTDTVCGDIHPPAVALRGDPKVTLEVGSAWEDPGASAQDTKDGDISAGLVRLPIQLPNAIGLYNLTYSVTDQAGLTGSARRLLELVDTTAPVVTLRGGADIDLEVQAARFEDPGADATDNDIGDTIAITVEGTLLVQDALANRRLGPVDLVYTACDRSRNCGSATRSVNIVNSDVPILRLIGSDPTLIEFGSLPAYTDAGAEAIDFVEGNLTEAIQVTGLELVDLTRLGTYILTYQVSTRSGASARPVQRRIVVQDTTPPSFALSGPSTAVVEAGPAYADAGTVFSDNFDSPSTLALAVRREPAAVDTRRANGTHITVR